MSGVWSGRFRYDEHDGDDTKFSAWLTVDGGRMTGSTLEPNTFAKIEATELDALLRGHVDDEEIVFLKTYQGLDQEPVYCEGKIVEQGRKIVGKWYFSWPDEISGTFEMNRQPATAETHESETGKARC